MPSGFENVAGKGGKIEQNLQCPYDVVDGSGIAQHECHVERNECHEGKWSDCPAKDAMGDELECRDGVDEWIHQTAKSPTALQASCGDAPLALALFVKVG